MPKKDRHLPDQEPLLIKGCISGNRISQSELYNLFAPEMLGVCFRYAKNRQEAEDILQEGFYRVFKYIHQYNGSGTLKAWIRKIMVNCALLKYSKDFLHPVIQLYEEDNSPAIESATLSNLHTKDLLKLVQHLPSMYRLVFNLYVFEGMKHREIAALLGISEGTSKSNLFQAKAILQRALLTKNTSSL